MAKDYDKELITKGILKFKGKLHVLDDNKSVALLSCPFPGIRKLKASKETELSIIVVNKDVLDKDTKEVKID